MSIAPRPRPQPDDRAGQGLDELDDPAPLPGITRSERAEISDVRVCRLAVEISEAQRREILEMEWYIKDIEENGPARTAEEAEAREVPDFEVAAKRECPGE